MGEPEPRELLEEFIERVAKLVPYLNTTPIFGWGTDPLRDLRPKANALPKCRFPGPPPDFTERLTAAIRAPSADVAEADDSRKRSSNLTTRDAA